MSSSFLGTVYCHVGRKCLEWEGRHNVLNYRLFTDTPGNHTAASPAKGIKTNFSVSHSNKGQPTDYGLPYFPKDTCQH